MTFNKGERQRETDKRNKLARQKSKIRKTLRDSKYDAFNHTMSGGAFDAIDETPVMKESEKRATLAFTENQRTGLAGIAAQALAEERARQRAQQAANELAESSSTSADASPDSPNVDNATTASQAKRVTIATLGDGVSAQINISSSSRCSSPRSGTSGRCTQEPDERSGVTFRNFDSEYSPDKNNLRTSRASFDSRATVQAECDAGEKAAEKDIVKTAIQLIAEKQDIDEIKTSTRQVGGKGNGNSRGKGNGKGKTESLEPRPVGKGNGNGEKTDSIDSAVASVGANSPEGPTVELKKQQTIDQTAANEYLRDFLTSIKASKSDVNGIVYRSGLKTMIGIKKYEYPLHRAVKENKIGIVGALLNGGADPTLKNDSNETPGEYFLRINQKYKISKEIGKMLDALS